MGMAKALDMLHGVPDHAKTPEQHDRAGKARAAIQTATTHREHAHRTLTPEAAEASKVMRIDLAEEYQKTKDEKTAAEIALAEAKEKLRLMRVNAAVSGQYTPRDQYAAAMADVVHKTGNLQRLQGKLAGLKGKITINADTSFPAMFMKTAELMLERDVFKAIVDETKQRQHRIHQSIGLKKK